MLQMLAVKRRAGTKITWTDQCGEAIEPITTKTWWAYLGIAIFLLSVAAWFTKSPVNLVFLTLEVALFLAVSITDIKYRIIPNGFCLLILIIKVADLFAPYLVGTTPAIWDNLIMSGVGLAMCFLVFFGGGILTGGKVGMGDVKLSMAIGFMLGWRQALIAIVLMGALMIPFVFTMPGGNIKNRFKQLVPMGPPFSMAAMLVLVASYTPLIQYMRF
jgi:Flp pilus assembly protein protease CpaA